MRIRIDVLRQWSYQPRGRRRPLPRWHSARKGTGRPLTKYVFAVDLCLVDIVITKLQGDQTINQPCDC